MHCFTDSCHYHAFAPSTLTSVCSLFLFNYAKIRTVDTIHKNSISYIKDKCLTVSPVRSKRAQQEHKGDQIKQEGCFFTSLPNGSLLAASGPFVFFFLLPTLVGIGGSYFFFLSLNWNKVGGHVRKSNGWYRHVVFKYSLLPWHQHP